MGKTAYVLSTVGICPGCWKEKKSPASSFFLKACLSFFGLYLCLKWGIAIVRSHLLLRYIWNDLKGRWYSDGYPQWSPSPQTGCGTEGEGAKDTDGADSVLRISLLTWEQEDSALAASQNRTVFPWLVYTIPSVCFHHPCHWSTNTSAAELCVALCWDAYHGVSNLCRFLSRQSFLCMPLRISWSEALF